MREDVLRLLGDEGRFVSGDRIARRLGVTRQALWKHVQELRRIGYLLDAVPNQGYRLVSAPDKLLPFEIKKRLGAGGLFHRIVYQERMPSTMDVAMVLGLHGEAEGTLVICEAQTQGRGRLRRRWVSPKGKGLYFSILLRPVLALDRIPLITLLASVAVAEGIKDSTGLRSGIKWPNDVLLGGRKAGGILAELNAEQDRVRFVVLGIGVNVNGSASALPVQATSLSMEKGEPLDRLCVLVSILRRFEENYRRFLEDEGRSVLDKWRGLSMTLGRRVRVDSNALSLEGVAEDVDSGGRLMLRLPSGGVEGVSAGDVTHCR
jgi:BirA family biotin operon repressor/biotin-[acetyl-CoA-carboxylase] ligase